MAEDLVNDMQPNSSEAQGIYAPELEDEERQEEAEESSKIASSLPIFEDLLEWFDEQIEITDSVRQARVTAKTHDTDLDNALIAHEIIAGLLSVQRDKLIARFDGYNHNKNNNDDE